MNNSSRLRLAISLAVFLAGCATGLSLADSTFTFYFSDHDTLVPAFFTKDMQRGLTGVIRLKIDFEKGRVAWVSTISTALKSETDSADRYPELVKLSVDRIIRTIKEWRSPIVSPFSTELTIELVLDPSLSPNTRAYVMENGNNGVVTKMTISGPVLDELKQHRSTKRGQ